MKVEVCKCPNCDSSISENTPFCPYCGSKLIFDDGTKRVEIKKTININKTITKNSTSVIRDEAKIRKAELADKADARNSKIILFISLFLILLGLGIPFTMMGVENAKAEKKAREGIYLQTPARDYVGCDYRVVVTELEGLGFTNIQVEAVPSVWYKKAGTVERISINGDSKFRKNTYFRMDASIIITYYKEDE